MVEKYDDLKDLKLLSIEELDLENKRILIRVDFNVPIKNGIVKDTTRIDATLKTIKYAQNRGKVILMSHLDRPSGYDPKFSLKPVYEILKTKLDNVSMAPDCVGKEVEEMLNNMRNGEILLLENLRFHNGEEKNDDEFTKALANLGDVYINEAFAAAHREHASVVGVPAYLKKQGKEVGIGYLMHTELETWNPVLKLTGNKILLVGGGKLKEKIKAVEKLSKKFNKVIVGGVVANVFLKAAGYNIGCSLVTEKGIDYTEKAKEILNKIDNIVLPKRVVVANGESRIVNINEIQLQDRIVDILIEQELLDEISKASVIVWFGPFGIYEQGYSKGTTTLKEAINHSEGYAVIGGGDIIAATPGIKAKLSTGGGASIYLLTNGTLPALEVLKTS